MPGVKIVVMYPRPKDVDAFEKIYQTEHIPLAAAKLVGKTKLILTKVLASPQGTPPYYRIAEVHFPSMQALEACMASASHDDCGRGSVHVVACTDFHPSIITRGPGICFGKESTQRSKMVPCRRRFSGSPGASQASLRTLRFRSGGPCSPPSLSE